jgi:hypothetical protein
MTNQSLVEPTSSKLTAIQQQRYDYLFPIYGPSAIDIVTNVHGKGKNSWPALLEKQSAIEQAKSHVQGYYDALYETFQIGYVYTPGQIIGNVNEARRALGLIPYVEKIKVQSEQDFFLLFLTQDRYELNTEVSEFAKTFVGYMPVARIKPSDN